eukprot:scaffold79982_cov82-Phaeocystis_antarctica.AAC.1
MCVEPVRVARATRTPSVTRVTGSGSSSSSEEFKSMLASEGPLGRTERAGVLQLTNGTRRLALQHFAKSAKAPRGHAVYLVLRSAGLWRMCRHHTPSRGSARPGPPTAAGSLGFGAHYSLGRAGSHLVEQNAQGLRLVGDALARERLLDHRAHFVLVVAVH